MSGVESGSGGEENPFPGRLSDRGVQQAGQNGAAARPGLECGAKLHLCNTETVEKSSFINISNLLKECQGLV